MKTKTALLAAGLAVSLALGGLIAQTDKQTPAPDTQSMNMMGMMNMSPEQCREMMKKMGMSDAMITRCHIMGTARVSAYDPAAVLTLRDQLKLTDDQVKELEAIATTTQEQVKTKLTAEQLTALEPIAATPSSMMQMGQSMHSMTGKNMMGMMMCPMMSASSSTAAKAQAHTGMICCPMMSH
ncbi:MAG: hypothetical protein WBL40_16845 [Terrimicrobiaceae bacterium]